MNCLSQGSVLGVLLAYVPLCSAREKVIAPDLSRINDGKIWSVINADCDTAIEIGKRVVRLKPKGKANTPRLRPSTSARSTF